MGVDFGGRAPQQLRNSYDFVSYSHPSLSQIFWLSPNYLLQTNRCHLTCPSLCIQVFPPSRLHLRLYHLFSQGQIARNAFCRRDIGLDLRSPTSTPAWYRVPALTLIFVLSPSPHAKLQRQVRRRSGPTLAYLITPTSARPTVSSELEPISSWAKLNNLRLYADKTKELIIHMKI